MSSIFRSTIGAAIIVAASAVSVSAQDYTWTLSNFRFGDYFDPGFVPPVFSGYDGGAAEGTFVVSKAGSGYVMKSHNFTTSPGPSIEEVGIVGSSANLGAGTGWAVAYNAVSGGGVFGTDGFDTTLDLQGEDSFGTEYHFVMTWDEGALADEMNGNNIGASFNLFAGLSYEIDDGPSFRRVNDDTRTQQNNTLRSGATSKGFPVGTLTLDRSTVQTVTTPEPASLALLGTGLLGIFAARRRKAG